jgi:hypothetical protein
MLENTLFVTYTNFYRLWAAELEGITPARESASVGEAAAGRLSEDKDDDVDPTID